MRRRRAQPSDVPSEWFTEFSFDEDEDDEGVFEEQPQEPTAWISAEEEAPDAVARWRRLFVETLEWLGGRAEAVEKPFKLEVSIDGHPRYFRVIRGQNPRHWGPLWADTNLDLLIENEALYEYWDQRFPRSWRAEEAEDVEEELEEEEFVEDELPPPMVRLQELMGFPDKGKRPGIHLILEPRDPDVRAEIDRLHEELDETDEYGWIGSTRYAYEPLAARQPELAERLLDRYAELFVRFARFAPSRLSDAKASLSLTVPTDDTQRVIRCTSRFTGSTTWHYDWDGSEDSALQFIEERAFEDGDWVDRDRLIAGPTEWDHVNG